MLISNPGNKVWYISTVMLILHLNRSILRGVPFLSPWPWGTLCTSLSVSMIVIATQVIEAICIKWFHIWSRLMTQRRVNSIVERRSVLLSACRAFFPFSLHIWSIIIQFLYTMDPISTFSILNYHVKSHYFSSGRLFNWEQMFSLPWEMICSLVTEGGGPCFITHIKSLLNYSIQRKYRPIFSLSIWGQVV